MIVDFHAHVEYKTPGVLYTADEFVAGMDQGGIQLTVVLGNDQADAGSCPAWRDPRGMQVPTNFSDEELASFCASHPKRLVGLTSISPFRYQPERKVERAIREFGMRGVKLYPHSGFYVNDSRLLRTYDICSRLHVPVVIHSGPKAVRWQRLKYNNPIWIDDVATDFPDLAIVVSHGGYPWVEEFMNVVHGNPNTFVDLTAMDYIEEVFKIPNLVENSIRRLVDIIGPKRLLWGSEGPFMNLPLWGQHDPSYYARSQEYLVKRFGFLTADEKGDILGGTAARLLGLAT